MSEETTSNAGLFLAAVATFALFDVASVASPYLRARLPAVPLGTILAYALLAALALSLAFLVGTLAFAVRARRFPSAGDLVRATLALFLVALHLGLLARTLLR